MTTSERPAPAEETGPSESHTAAMQSNPTANSRGEGYAAPARMDGALSAALRDDGVAVANSNAEPDWRSCADTAIGHLAAIGRPFSADDVAALIPAPDHPCRWGARFHAAVRAGTVVPVGYTLSGRQSRRRGVQRLYVGAAR